MSATDTVFQAAPNGADFETTNSGAQAGNGTIVLGSNETEIITFDMTNDPEADTPTFSAAITSADTIGTLVTNNASSGLFTYTVTEAQWLAAGSPSSITITFSDDDVNFGNPSNDATYTLSIFCFGGGTMITTPEGDTTVETLQIGDLIRTAGGRDVAVKWVGVQTVSTVFSETVERLQPVRISQGALGNGQPHADLTVTADHGMVLDGYVINAGALVNGTTIRFLPMAEMGEIFTVYHIETEDHDVILANGAPAETFCDANGRSVFDNHQDYLDLYGEDAPVREMTMPRIVTQRLVPPAIKARLARVDNRLSA